MESKEKVYRVTIELNEIKHLVLERVDEAQDVNNTDNLSRCTIYNMWHIPLIQHYKKYKNRSPLMADKLAFVVLLSYPKKYIETLDKISDLKLYNKNEKDDPESDFIYEGTMDEQGSNCICSKCSINIVHIVRNKYSGIILQVGSDCIERSKLLTNKELQKSKDAEKEYHRKQYIQQKELKRLEQIRLEQEQKIKDYDPCMDCGKLEIHKSESHWRLRCIPCFKKFKQKEQEKKEEENKPILEEGICYLKHKKKLEGVSFFFRKAIN